VHLGRAGIGETRGDTVGPQRREQSVGTVHFAAFR
jgi:hypothetical protein